MFKGEIPFWTTAESWKLGFNNFTRLLSPDEALLLMIPSNKKLEEKSFSTLRHQTYMSSFRMEINSFTAYGGI